MLFITSCYVDKMDIFVNPFLLMHARRQFFHYFKLTEKSFVKKKKTQLLPSREIFEEHLLNPDNIQQDYIHE